MSKKVEEKTPSLNSVKSADISIPEKQDKNKDLNGGKHPTCFGDYSPGDEECKGCYWNNEERKWTCERETIENFDEGDDSDY